MVGVHGGVGRDDRALQRAHPLCGVSADAAHPVPRVPAVEAAQRREDPARDAYRRALLPVKRARLFVADMFRQHRESGHSSADSAISQPHLEDSMVFPRMIQTSLTTCPEPLLHL